MPHLQVSRDEMMFLFACEGRGVGRGARGLAACSH